MLLRVEGHRVRTHISFFGAEKGAGDFRARWGE